MIPPVIFMADDHQSISTELCSTYYRYPYYSKHLVERMQIDAMDLLEQIDRCAMSHSARDLIDEAIEILDRSIYE